MRIVVTLSNYLPHSSHIMRVSWKPSQMINHCIHIYPLEIAGMVHQKNALTGKKSHKIFASYSMFIMVTFLLCCHCCYHVLIKPALEELKYLYIRNITCETLDWYIINLVSDMKSPCGFQRSFSFIPTRLYFNKLKSHEHKISTHIQSWNPHGDFKCVSASLARPYLNKYKSCEHTFLIVD